MPKRIRARLHNAPLLVKRAAAALADDFAVLRDTESRGVALLCSKRAAPAAAGVAAMLECRGVWNVRRFALAARYGAADVASIAEATAGVPGTRVAFVYFEYDAARYALALHDLSRACAEGGHTLAVCMAGARAEAFSLGLGLAGGAWGPNQLAFSIQPSCIGKRCVASRAVSLDARARVFAVLRGCCYVLRRRASPDAGG